jgi:replicative DNA helicase
MSTLNEKLNDLGVDATVKSEWDFTSKEEAHVIAHLTQNSIHLSKQMVDYITPDAFNTLECKYIIAVWKNWYQNYQGFPPVAILSESIAKSFLADDQVGEDILKIVDADPDPNMSVRVQEGMYKWLKFRSYGKLFSADTVQKYHEGDYTHIDQLVDEAKSIIEADARPQTLAEHLESLWNHQDKQEVFPLGIESFDPMVGGGIQRKQLFIWVAPTNAGKTHFMIHNAVKLAKASKKVLFITFETAARDCTARMVSNDIGCLTFEIKHMPPDKQKKVRERAVVLSEWIKILELEPDRFNADQIGAIVKDHVRSTGFMPDVVILDYLDLIISNKARRDESTYEAQKNVSTQLRGLAQKLNVAVITATQTNRDGYVNKSNLDLSHLAESFGKAMAADYVATINIAELFADEGRALGLIHLAKSRHSAKGGYAKFEIDYTRSRVLPYAGDIKLPGDDKQKGYTSGKKKAAGFTESD